MTPLETVTHLKELKRQSERSFEIPYPGDLVVVDNLFGIDLHRDNSDIWSLIINQGN